MIVEQKLEAQCIYALYGKRSVLYARLGNHIDSLADANIAVMMNQNWAKGWLYKGAAHFSLGNKDAALSSFEEGVKA